jgi:hypothetical protein
MYGKKELNMCQEHEVKTKKCNKCKEDFPAINVYFFSNKKSVDGLDKICKECNGSKFQDFKNKNKSEIDGYKKCSKCKKDYPLNNDYFHKKADSKDGYSTICKECKGHSFTHYNCKEGYQVCIKCQEELELNNINYYKDKNSRTGFTTVCKKCLTGLNFDNFEITNWYSEQGNVFKENWTLDQVVWLYNNYINVNKQDLLKKFPNKNYNTLTNLTSKWNIKKHKRSKWSNEDVQFLKDNYPNMSQEKLLEKFSGKTWHSISNKASKLNIKRDKSVVSLTISESHKGYVFSEERKREISRTRKGVNSGHWRGGLTPLHIYFRGILYEWKMDSLKAYDYKCALTKLSYKDLQIHHANENFSDIIVETLSLLNLPIYKDMLQYTDEERSNINKCFLELNYKYGLGIPLNKKLHKLFHVIFGVKNNTQEQFEEFKQRYFNNEFDDVLNTKETTVRNTHRKTFKKLDKIKVLEIKELLHKGFPINYISKMFETSNTAIYNIKTNKTWKNIEINEKPIIINEENILKYLKKGTKPSLRIPIIQFSIEGEFIREWTGASEASYVLNIDSSAITKCCRGKQLTYKGYKWKYKDLEEVG